MSERGPMPVVVLISGGGTNLQAIIDAAAKGLPIDIRAVISNRPGAFGLERAERAGIATEVLDHRDFPDRAAYDAALMARIDAYRPGLVVMAGFMRILGDDFVRHYEGRMLNIHPSLLPRYRGLDTHARCLENGDREHGATVHFLAKRVLEQEHRIYPQAIAWFAEGRLTLREGRACLDGEPLQANL